MTTITEFITALSRYGFLQSALLAAIMVGIMSGIIGAFIILRGMSLMGDAIYHAVLPGVAIAYMLGINLLIGFVSTHSKLKTDTSIGIVFSAFYALGFILIAAAGSAVNLNHILFGNILAVSDGDIMTTAVVLGIVLLFVVTFYKELQITSFDPVFAQTYGLKVQVIHYSLMLVLTLVTVSALQTVGIILVVAMLITPAATAFLWTNRLPVMLGLSAAIGVVSATVGLYLSYTFNWASGPAIVLVAAALFLLSFALAPKQGFIRLKARVRRPATKLPGSEEVL